MSSYKTLALLLVCLALGACGFKPLYGDNGISRAYSTVEIGNIPDRDGQFLRNLLMDRLYAESPLHDPRYLLVVYNLDKRLVGLGIRKDATSTRGLLEMKATLRLIDKSTGEEVLTRSISASGGYNRLDDRYATLVSEIDRTELVLKELSSVIMTELDLHFQRTAAAP